MRQPDAAFSLSHCGDTLLSAGAALMRRYGEGSRYVGDVLAALTVLVCRGKYAIASHLAAASTRVCTPTPYALWDWLVSYVEFLDAPACIALARAAAADRRVADEVRRRAEAVVRNEDALSAMSAIFPSTAPRLHAALLERSRELQDAGFHYTRVGRRAIATMARRANM